MEGDFDSTSEKVNDNYVHWGISLSPVRPSLLSLFEFSCWRLSCGWRSSWKSSMKRRAPFPASTGGSCSWRSVFFIIWKCNMVRKPVPGAVTHRAKSSYGCPLFLYFRARIFKRFRSPGIDSASLSTVAWRVGPITLFVVLGYWPARDYLGWRNRFPHPHQPGFFFIMIERTPEGAVATLYTLWFRAATWFDKWRQPATWRTNPELAGQTLMNIQFCFLFLSSKSRTSPSSSWEWSLWIWPKPAKWRTAYSRRWHIHIPLTSLCHTHRGRTGEKY